jgi:PAS domain S-box-containing protein
MTLTGQQEPHQHPSQAPLPPTLPAPAAAPVPTVARPTARRPRPADVGHFLWRLPATGRVTKDLLPWRTFTGQPVEAVQGVGWLDAVHPSDRPRVRASWQRAVAAARPFGADCRVRRHDGVYRTLSLHLLPVRDRQGRLRRWEGMCLDITERTAHEREHAERRARAVAAQRIEDLTHEQAVRREAEAANQQLERLQALTDTALAHLALDDLLQELLARIVSVMGVESVGILLLDADGQQLQLRAARNLKDIMPFGATIPMGQGISGRVAATRTPLIVDDLSTFPLVYPQVRELEQSAAGVPLVVEERLLGAVYMGSAVPSRFTEADIQLLQRVADRIALAIDRARLFEAEQAAHREAQAALACAQVSERRFQGLADAGIIGIVVGDTEQAIEANDAYLQMLGYTREDLLAGRVSRVAVTPPEYRAVAERAMQETLMTGACAPVEKEYVRRDGSRVPALAGMALLERDPVRFLSFVLDLSERKRLEQEREAARVEAERQAAQLDRVFEAMADGVVVYDAQGRIQRTNAAQHRLIGRDAAPPDYFQLPVSERLALFTAHDEQGRPLGPDEGPLPRVLAGEVLTGSEALSVHVRTLDGREVELSVSAAPLRDQEGRLVGAVCVFRDQTARRRLEREHAEQAAELEATFEAMADGVVVYDAEGQILRENAAAHRILGLDAAPPGYAQLPVPERMAFFAVRDEQDRPLAPEERSLLRVLSDQRLTGAAARDLRLRTLDGREVELSVSVVPVRDQEGRLVGAVRVMHDQTERNRLAREREAARANELAMQETTRRMDEFLATASHELKSPLATMKMALQALTRRLSGHSSTDTAPAGQAQTLVQAQPFLGTAERAVSRMMRLVGDLLEVTRSRVGALELRLAPCDLAAIVREAVAEQQQVHPARTVRLEVAAPTQPVPVVADADRLGQVVTNYLTNALTYSPIDRPVAVRLEVVGSSATVAVRDEGPGIPADEQVRVWELYHRVPGVVGQADGGVGLGLGLGLHISRTIIERHGGQVGVESEVGKGSTFWFTLPVARAEAGGDPTAAPTS